MSFLIIAGLIPAIALMTIMLIAATLKHKPDISQGKSVRVEWRKVLVVRLIFLLLGVVVAVMFAQNLTLGVGVMLAPAVVGIFIIGGVLAGEALVRAPAREHDRAASLTRREIRAYLPRNLTRTVLTLFAIHLITLIATTVTASPDDLGRVGRALEISSHGMTCSQGPYPGWFYTQWLLVFILIGVVVTIAALHRVVQRPRGFAITHDSEDALRRRSTRVILGAAGIALAISQIGISLAAANMLLGVGDCGPNVIDGISYSAPYAGWELPLGYALLASVVYALYAGVRSIHAVLLTSLGVVTDDVATVRN